jgi:hypothetical protein
VRPVSFSVDFDRLTVEKGAIVASKEVSVDARA